MDETEDFLTCASSPRRAVPSPEFFFRDEETLRVPGSAMAALRSLGFSVFAGDEG